MRENIPIIRGIKYSKESWDKMIKRFGDDEKVFSMLLKKFFGSF